MFSLDPLTPTIGGEISGLDLGAPLGADVIERIYAALIEHLVVFFRDQPVTPEAHIAFAQCFGDLDRPHPHYPHVAGFERIVLLENDGARPPDTNTWHTDLTFMAEPPFASILIAREMPPTGGDTLWLSLYAAYEALPDGMRRELAALSAIHDLGDFRNDYTVGRTGTEELEAAARRFGSAIHPLVKHHPVSGRPYLYVNQSFVTHVVGMTARESDSLLRYLYDHIERPEHQVRFRWRRNSIAMWDNRVTQHYAIADYLPHYRCMNRVTVVNDRRAAERAVVPLERQG